MNIIKWFKDKAGKIPLSVMQVAGAGAVVAVAGFGAYQYLNSPAEENNSFAPASYGGDVVYVSAASGGSYGSNGEVQTAFHAAPSRAIELTARQEAAEKRVRAMQESESYYAGSQEMTAPAGGNAQAGGVGYEFGSTNSSLGMGGDKGAEADGGIEGLSGSFAGIQNMIQNQTAAVQAAMNGAQGGAQGAQGAAGKEGVAEGGAALAGAAMASAGKTLGSISPNWSQGVKTGGAGGANAINNEFVVQNSGKNAPQIANMPVSGGDMNMGGGNTADNPALTPNGKFSNLGGSRASTIRQGRTQGQGGAELAQMRKQSADIARNKYRAANEPSSVFLAGSNLAGGIRVTKDSTPSTGAGVSSGTFNDPYRGVKAEGMQSAIRDEITQTQKVQDEYNSDVKNFQTWFWGMVATCVASMIFIPIILKISKSWGPWAWMGWVLAGIAALASLFMIIKVMVMGAQLHKTWSDNEFVDYSNGWTLAGYIVGGILGLGVAASFIWHDAFSKFYDKVMEWMKNGWDWLKNLGASGGTPPAGTPPVGTPTPPVPPAGGGTPPVA